MLTDKTYKQIGFSLIEILVVVLISSILIIVAMPSMTRKLVASKPDVSVLKCVKKEFAGDLNSDACSKAINHCLYGINNACTSISNIIENGRDNERMAARNVMAATCDRGGDEACSYMVTSCVKDSNACHTGYENDLNKYLTLDININSPARMPIFKYASAYFYSDNKNIIDEVNGDCSCSGSGIASIACGINGTTTCKWQTSIDSYYKLDNQGKAISVDKDGNLYVAGYSSNGSDNDAVIIKFDSYGNILWKKVLSTSYTEEVRGVSVDSSSNIYLIGTTTIVVNSSYNMFLTKLDKNGNILWNNKYDVASSALDVFNAGTVDSTGNVIVTGRTQNGSTPDIVALKVGGNGSTVWQKSINSGSSYSDTGYGVAVDSNNDIYFVGSVLSSIYYPTIVKMSSDGNSVLWSRTLNSEGTFKAVAVDKNNNIYATGYINSSRDMLVTKIDSSGNIKWATRLYTGSSDEAFGIAVDRQCNVYITGYSGNYMAVVKLNTNGEKLWDKLVIPSAHSVEKGNAISVDRSEHIYITGSTPSSSSYNMPVLKLNRTQSNSSVFSSASVSFAPLASFSYTIEDVTYTPSSYDTFIMSNFGSYTTDPEFAFN